MEVAASYMQLVGRHHRELEQLGQVPNHLIPKYQVSVLWHELRAGQLHIHISLSASG
jgi:hypothetical protein